VQRSRDLVFCALAFLFGLTIIISAWRLRSAFGYDVIGPRVLPIFAGFGICVSAAVTSLQTTRSLDNQEGISVAALPVMLISSGILFMYFFVLKLGWIVSATVLFTLVSLAFADRRIVATIGVGGLLSTATYLVFTHALGVKLPTGNVWTLLN
jgi:putative tricarboxylic transport membrane protein